MTIESLYSATEMRSAEERYPGFPGAAPELMERAAAAVAEEVLRTYPDARRIAVVCGAGANGGDGRIAARMLRDVGKDAYETDEPAGADVVIDALFGTGFRGAPRAEAAVLVDRINAAGAPVVAVDLPSGVDASTGQVEGTAVRADATVTFHGRKVGLVVAPGRFHAGRVVVADIGLTHARTAIGHATARLLGEVPLRGPRDTKYSAGHVVVVGGSEGMTGAVALAALAALRADAGYVTALVPRASLPAVEALAIEPVKRGFDWEDAADVLRSTCARAGAVAIGPGLGRSAQASRLVSDALASVPVPVVVDADALFALEPVEREAVTVLTPHAGELARLLGETAAWVDAHRLDAARAASSRFRSVVVLKGADTIVASADGETVVCDTGPPALATAGTGDVLTGIIAAFLAKGMTPVRAAAAAAVAHGLAALAVPHQAGLVASDLFSTLPSVLERAARGAR